MSDKQFSKSRVHDLLGSIFGIIAIILLVVSPYQVDTSGPDPFYKGPLIFPILVFILMALGAMPSMWRLIKPEAGASWYLDGYGKPKNNMIILVLLVLYLFGLIVFGLEFSTWLFLVVSLKLVKQDSLLKIALFPLLVTLILYLVFRVFLDVWFPQPLIVEWILE